MMIAPPAPEAPNVKAQHEMPGFRHWNAGLACKSDRKSRRDGTCPRPIAWTNAAPLGL